MARRDWSRDELILAMNLYCQLPFGKLHKGNPEIIALAKAIDRTPSSVAMKLCNLASLDPAHQQRGVKGLSAASKGDRVIWQDFHDDWEQLSIESEALREKLELTTTDTESREDVSDGTFVGETESTAMVKIRRAQRFFRRSVLASYECKCCITGIDLPQLLIASHILPWGKYPEHRADPRNGLCLSRLHDAAFDRGLITFDEEFRLVLSATIKDSTTNQVMQLAFSAFEGKTICLPNRFRPPADFLDLHRVSIFSSS